MMRKIIGFIFIVGATLVVAQIGQVQALPAQTAYKAPIVRVAVIKDAKQLTLTVKSGFNILPLEMDEVLYSENLLKSSLVVPTNWGIKIADMDFKLYGIRIVPLTDSAIHINDRSFRGEVDIIRQKNETLLVVNHINVEDYLRGVLYHEVSHWWPRAVLEAQAIASRTFALYQVGVNKNKDYDLECSVLSQVYGGATSEKIRTNDAVYKTIGKILTYKGSIFPAYFHATCAGHTEDAAILWKTNIQPLKGVICGFCKQSPHFYWKRSIAMSDIENTLGIKNIKDIIATNRSSSGRVVDMLIRTNNDMVSYSAKDFRQKLGGNVIKSTMFKIRVDKNYSGKLFANIEGVGWGHGVGMCQWGAFGMARRNYNAEKILKYYYPGVDIEMYNGQ